MRNFIVEDLRGKKVILRLDLNLPISNGIVSDQTRLQKSLPTLEALIDKQAKIILISHFGRPKGTIVPEMSLKPVYEALKKALKTTTIYFANSIEDASNLLPNLKNQEILFVENIRFYEAEEKGDEAFAKQISLLGEYFVNDAFSCCHRAHASITGINKFLPSAPGLLLKEEVNMLTKLMTNPIKPLTAIVGGAKVSSKLDLLNNLIKKVDNIIIGGAMANTFLLAKGFNLGKSLVEENLLDTANHILTEANKYGCKIVLPKDGIISKEFSPTASCVNKDLNEVKEDEMVLDIGVKSLNEIKNILEASKTVLWNGPVGAYEIDIFAKGTIDIANQIAELTEKGKLVSVAGGGDVVAAISKANVKDKFSYISTAGGAFLEWLEGKNLPGIEALLHR